MQPPSASTNVPSLASKSALPVSLLPFCSGAPFPVLPKSSSQIGHLQSGTSSILAYPVGILSGRWQNLKEFVEWKLQEERRLSIAFKSELCHNDAFAVFQTKGLIYACRNKSDISCQSFLKIEPDRETGEVFGLYNTNHSHPVGIPSSVNEIKKDVSTSTSTSTTSGASPGGDKGKTKASATGSFLSPLSNPTHTMFNFHPLDSSNKDNHPPSENPDENPGWNTDEYMRSIVTSIARFEKMKRADSIHSQELVKIPSASQPSATSQLSASNRHYIMSQDYSPDHPNLQNIDVLPNQDNWGLHCRASEDNFVDSASPSNKESAPSDADASQTADDIFSDTFSDVLDPLLVRNGLVEASSNDSRNGSTSADSDADSDRTVVSGVSIKGGKFGVSVHPLRDLKSGSEENNISYSAIWNAYKRKSDYCQEPRDKRARTSQQVDSGLSTGDHSAFYSNVGSSYSGSGSPCQPSVLEKKDNADATLEQDSLSDKDNQSLSGWDGQWWLHPVPDVTSGGEPLSTVGWSSYTRFGWPADTHFGWGEAPWEKEAEAAQTAWFSQNVCDQSIGFQDTPEHFGVGGNDERSQWVEDIDITNDQSALPFPGTDFATSSFTYFA